jgi:four helix bundle protein
MAAVERFEDLIAWQKARLLTKAIFKATGGGKFARNFRLTGQIEGAAVSVMSNIAEGFERDGLPEFHRFLTIAKASCGEVRSLLYAALDAEFIDGDTFNRLKDQAEEVGRVVGGLRTSVERRLASSNQRFISEDVSVAYRFEPLQPEDSALGTRHSALAEAL